MKRRVLITGATGQVGSRTINHLLIDDLIQVVAAIRSPAKAESFATLGIETVILDSMTKARMPPHSKASIASFCSRGTPSKCYAQARRFIERHKSELAY